MRLFPALHRPLLLSLLVVGCTPAEPGAEPGGDEAVAGGDTAAPAGDDDHGDAAGGDSAPGGDAETAPGVALRVSHEGGFYWDPFDLELSTEIPGGQILYTVDGSDPQPDGAAVHVYDEPISIPTTTVLRVKVFDRERFWGAAAHTYFFVEHALAQRAPAGAPTQWWASQVGGPFPADYDMDPEVVGSPVFGAGVLPAFFQAPILSVIMDPDELFGPQGIHENSLQRGVAWERGASMELFGAGFPERVQQFSGIRMQGGSSRYGARSTKKSFRLVFKRAWGPPKLNYPVFEEGHVQKFDVMVLRGHYNRSWAHYLSAQRLRACYMRDTLTADLQRAMGHVSPRARYVQLLLNGSYWGVYIMQERPDASFQAEYFGGEKEEYDALNAGDPLDGDLDAWNRMMAIVEGGLATPERLAELEEMLDLENFMDYMLLNTYLGNIDFPDRNWYAGRRRVDGEKFRFFAWDGELVISDPEDNRLNVDWPGSPGRIFLRLRENPEFLIRFADRVQRHLFGDGALTTEALAARWEALSRVARPLVFAESARWGDHYRDERLQPDAALYTVPGQWDAENNRIAHRYIPQRRQRYLLHLIEADLYPSVPAPEGMPRGGEVPAGGNVELSAAYGTIYYTIDGSDPRLAGDELSAAALTYGGPVSVAAGVTLKARARAPGGEWSALVEARSATIP